MKVTEPNSVNLRPGEAGKVHLSGYTYIQAGADPFTGEYEYTPTDTAQVIEIENKRATQNIIINPIPSNYGRITWNGSVLTVS